MDFIKVELFSPKRLQSLSELHPALSGRQVCPYTRGHSIDRYFTLKKNLNKISSKIQLSKLQSACHLSKSISSEGYRKMGLFYFFLVSKCYF